MARRQQLLTAIEGRRFDEVDQHGRRQNRDTAGANARCGVLGAADLSVGGPLRPGLNPEIQHSSILVGIEQSGR